MPIKISTSMLTNVRLSIVQRALYNTSHTLRTIRCSRLQTLQHALPAASTDILQPAVSCNTYALQTVNELMSFCHLRDYKIHISIWRQTKNSKTNETKEQMHKGATLRITHWNNFQCWHTSYMSNLLEMMWKAPLQWLDNFQTKATNDRPHCEPSDKLLTCMTNKHHW